MYKLLREELERSLRGTRANGMHDLDEEWGWQGEREEVWTGNSPGGGGRRWESYSATVKMVTDFGF